jgi:dolichol kinase
LKPAGGDQSFSLKALHLVSISIHLLDLYVAQERVPLVILVCIVGVVVLLLLLRLLSKCAKSYWALRYYQRDLKRLLLLRYVLWLLWLWHVMRHPRPLKGWLVQTRIIMGCHYRCNDA